MICSETQGLPILSLLELIKELIGSYSFYPSNTLYIYNVCSLLLLLLLFYVNLFKERFFVAPFLSEASAKVRQIFGPCKYFEENFQ